MMFFFFYNQFARSPKNDDRTLSASFVELHTSKKGKTCICLKKGICKELSNTEIVVVPKKST